ncbi:unnamed protein product, partial [Durusdinium trenchii]
IAWVVAAATAWVPMVVTLIAWAAARFRARHKPTAPFRAYLLERRHVFFPLVFGLVWGGAAILSAKIRLVAGKARRSRGPDGSSGLPLLPSEPVRPGPSSGLSWWNIALYTCAGAVAVVFFVALYYRKKALYAFLSRRAEEEEGSGGAGAAQDKASATPIGTGGEIVKHEPTLEDFQASPEFKVLQGPSAGLLKATSARVFSRLNAALQASSVRDHWFTISRRLGQSYRSLKRLVDSAKVEALRQARQAVEQARRARIDEEEEEERRLADPGRLARIGKGKEEAQEAGAEAKLVWERAEARARWEAEKRAEEHELREQQRRSRKVREEQERVSRGLRARNEVFSSEGPMNRVPAGQIHEVNAKISD